MDLLYHWISKSLDLISSNDPQNYKSPMIQIHVCELKTLIGTKRELLSINQQLQQAVYIDSKIHPCAQGLAISLGSTRRNSR